MPPPSTDEENMVLLTLPFGSITKKNAYQIKIFVMVIIVILLLILVFVLYVSNGPHILLHVI